MPPLMNPNLRNFWATKSRYKTLTGGRGSSKSHDACARLTYLTKNFKLKVMAVRQFQNRIEDSVYTLIKDKIDAFGYQNDFKVLNNKIHSISTGSEFLFYGINRNITEIKSTENVDILYIEEAHALTKEQWEILKPTIRKNNSEIWIIFNPNLITDFAYERFVLKSPKDNLHRHINYNENPFASETFLKEVEEAKEEDYEDYEHTYLGIPKKDDEESFIKLSWVEACIDAHLKLNIEVRGKRVIGYDIADDGNDLCVDVCSYGILTYKIKAWKAKEDELEESAEKTFDLAIEENAIINYDTIGVGASAGSTFKRLNKERKEYDNNFKLVKYQKFDAGAGVENPNKEYEPQRLNKDHFENLKAQAWQDIADRLKHTYNAVTKGKDFDEDKILSISSEIPKKDLDMLKKELSIPRKQKSKRGLIMVEDKKSLLKRGFQSPNYADAYIMAHYQTKYQGYTLSMFD